MRNAMVAAMLLAAGSPVAAEEGWRFQLMPYVWAAGIDGDLRHPRLPGPVEVSQSFGDVLERLDSGAMLAFEGHRGRWGFLVDGLYTRVSDSGTLAVGPLPIAARARATTFTGLGALQFRAVDGPGGTLDLVAGARVWSLDTRIALAAPPGIPLPPGVPAAYDRAERLDWVDAMAGARARVQLSPAVSLHTHAMFGAGGSGFASDAMVAVGFGLGRRVSLLAGYRQLTADIEEDGGVAFDGRLHGPVLGLGLGF